MRQIEVRYRYRLRVSNTQANQLKEVFDSCRFVWNRALGDWTDAWKHEQRSVQYGEADRALTLRRKELDWLRGQPSVPEQQALRDLYRSIAAFFDKKNPTRRPTFKKKGTLQSARWTKNGFAIKNDRLHIAVGGGRTALRVVWSRELASVPASVTVYRDRCGHYWASFVCRIEVPEVRVRSTGSSTGLDVGLTTFATVEDAEHDVQNPRYLRHAQRALARSQRNMSRKKKGSKNRARAKTRLARQHAKVASQRLDFQHKAAHGLVANYDQIGVEDLRVKNMMARSKRVGHRRAKTGLSRAISDAGWSQFVRVLEHQATKAGVEIVEVPRCVLHATV